MRKNLKVQTDEQNETSDEVSFFYTLTNRKSLILSRCPMCCGDYDNFLTDVFSNKKEGMS